MGTASFTMLAVAVFVLWTLAVRAGGPLPSPALRGPRRAHRPRDTARLGGEHAVALSAVGPLGNRPERSSAPSATGLPTPPPPPAPAALPSSAAPSVLPLPSAEAERTILDLNRELEAKNLSLNEAINRLSALNQISRTLGMQHDRHQIYSTVASLSHELLNAEICHLLLLSEDRKTLVLECSRGLGEDVPRRTVPVGHGLAGWVARNRKPLLVADFSKQDQFAPLSSLGYERRSALSVPIMIREELMGVLTLINKRNGASFTEDERILMATIASEAAMALHNALLLEKIQKSYFSVVQSLITAVEAKDIYTRGHSERVTQYSLLIAEQMGFTLAQLEVIQQAGILHDIGKITVELSILNKPSALEAEEYSKIKLHPVVGYRILAPIDFEDRVKTCVLQHHERLDGNGYPNGASADEILLESRILAVADAFDAMTTQRPYRAPLSISRALGEIQGCVGTQFDDQVVAVFTRVVETMTSTNAIGRILR